MGASLNVDQLPAGAMLQQQTQEIRRRFTLAGGDDYELCFTAPAHLREQVIEAGLRSNTAVTRVGSIEAEPGLRLLDQNGQTLSLELKSFDHFISD